MGDFGEFQNLCADSTLPICNIFSQNHTQQSDTWGGCELTGISLSGDRKIGNLGTILLCGLGIAATAFLILLSEAKKAAVGRREMQIFLLGYILILICEIFSVGEFPLNEKVRIAFSGAHIGLIIATTWMLMLNGIVGYQLLDDGTALSLGLLSASGLVLFIGTGYIALDTGYQWTGEFNGSYDSPHKHIALYVLYLIAPLVFIVAFFVLEAFLVIRVLAEMRPMFYLAAALVLFAGGQIFNFVASSHICDGTDGKIDGALFQTLLTNLAVGMVWVFWSSITEDDWPITTGNSYA